MNASYVLELNEESNDKDNGTNSTEPQPNEINTNQVVTDVFTRKCHNQMRLQILSPQLMSLKESES